MTEDLEKTSQKTKTNRKTDLFETFIKHQWYCRQGYKLTVARGE